MKRTHSLSLVLLVSLLWMGCERSPYYGMSEGKVVYELEMDAEGIPAMMSAMMPSEAVTWFSNGRSCTVMEGAGGFFENRLLLDPEKKLFASLTSMMGNKVAVVMDSDSVMGKAKNKNLEIDYTGNKKEIAGIMCQEAVIKGDSGAVFRVFFTDELDVRAPDMGAMFSQIDGLMMEYEIEMRDFRLKLKAKEVSADKPDPELFTIPKDYEIKKTNNKYYQNK